MSSKGDKKEEAEFRAIMAKSMRDQQVMPRSIACSRGNTFDAELTFGGKGYVVSTGHRTRDAAKAAAEPHAETIRKELLKVGRDYVKRQGWQEAKS